MCSCPRGPDWSLSWALQPLSESEVKELCSFPNEFHLLLFLIEGKLSFNFYTENNVTVF